MYLTRQTDVENELHDEYCNDQPDAE